MAFYCVTYPKQKTLWSYGSFPRESQPNLPDIGNPMQLNKDILNTDLDAGFVIQNGVKILIKRQRFEQFLDKLSSI